VIPRSFRYETRNSLIVLALLGGNLLHATGAAAQTSAPVQADAQATVPPTPDTALEAPLAPTTQAAQATPAAQAAPAAEQAATGPTVSASTPVEAVETKKKETPWYEKIKLRGYTQFRYNRLPSFNSNDDFKNSQGDRTIGQGNGFSIRRARLIIFGDVHERVSIYLQPDFASTIGDQLHVTILRDWYADLFLDRKKEFRLRVGQSKVPYGFENLQSSQNRLPLDRNDALNSAVKDERDIGVFFYWAPEEIRARFKHLVDSGLKGSGDYGVVGLGVYNGQTANRPALSDDMHVIGRVTWPFKFGEQFVEVGGGGYFGKYYVSTDAPDVYSLETGKIKDARAHASLVVYPQPFGFVAEGTYGVGPSQGDSPATANEIKARTLFGGYAQVMYKIDDLFGTVALIPFARATYYDGGKKFETNAPHHEVKELELGFEWQLIKNLELVTAYDLASRTTQGKEQKGHVTRVQLQVNY
jgi:hypothetical protein